MKSLYASAGAHVVAITLLIISFPIAAGAASPGCNPQKIQGSTDPNAVDWVADGELCKTSCSNMGICYLGEATPEEMRALEEALEKRAEELRQSLGRTSPELTQEALEQYAEKLRLERGLSPELTEQVLEQYAEKLRQQMDPGTPLPAVPETPLQSTPIADWSSCAGTSVVNCLGNNGYCSSFECRRDLAVYHEIVANPADYKGTADQNTRLRDMILDQGVPPSTPLAGPVPLPRPRPADTVTTTPIPLPNPGPSDLPTAPALPAPNALPNANALPFNGSIVNYLASINIPSSFAYRSGLAARAGISGYRGTATQNIQLLVWVMNGGR